jgi:tetratricopeptide (TPR) repeat protein
MGRHDEAEPLFRRAIAIREKANGPHDPALAAHLNNLAEVCRGLARYDEAEAVYQRAISIRERTRLAGHPEMTSLVNNLAALRTDQGRYTGGGPTAMVADTDGAGIWAGAPDGSGRRPENWEFG